LFGECIMKVSVFSPYGATTKESGVVSLLANYIAKRGAEVAQFQCDGGLPACGRDKLGGMVRTPFQCAQCIGEQNNLAVWSGVAHRLLSNHIVADDVKTAFEWILSVSGDQLRRLEFRGVNLWEACETEMTARWQSIDMSSLSEPQERDLRALFHAYIRTAVATERFYDGWKPQLALVTALGDPVVHAHTTQLQRLGVDVAVCRYEEDGDVVVVDSPFEATQYSTPLILEGITSMRADPRSWGPEVTAMAHELLSFLGCAPDKVLPQ
jgi:hypothetical protein